MDALVERVLKYHQPLPAWQCALVKRKPCLTPEAGMPSAPAIYQGGITQHALVCPYCGLTGGVVGSELRCGTTLWSAEEGFLQA